MEILVYLRPQLQRLESAYCQNIKEGSLETPAVFFTNVLGSKYFNYQNL